MRGKGITYDTGFISGGGSTHEPFDSELVGREMRIIHDDLHCNAVRLTGGYPDRLELAAAQAADAGLEVWLSPFTNDLTTEQLLDLLADLATRAEQLRLRGTEVVFVTGAELSLFNQGFLPGNTLDERLALLAHPTGLRELLPEVAGRLNAFLGTAASRVRERFGGKLTYAAIPFEGVDWTPFDFIGFDIYRSREVADHFAANIRALVARGKPVAITEFGCVTCRGAADMGGRGALLVEWDGATPVRLKADLTRDEDEQATCLRELLDIFSAEGVDTAFACTFASYNLPHRDDPREDYDLVSYGVVKVLEDRLGRTYPSMPWEPKAAFTALAEHYRG